VTRLATTDEKKWRQGIILRETREGRGGAPPYVGLADLNVNPEKEKGSNPNSSACTARQKKFENEEENRGVRADAKSGRAQLRIVMQRIPKSGHARGGRREKKNWVRQLRWGRRAETVQGQYLTPPLGQAKFGRCKKALGVGKADENWG